MINLDEFKNWGLDSFDERLPALPYTERPEVLGDDGK